MAGGPSEKLYLTLRAVDDLYLPGPASYLFRCSKGYSKTYSIKPSTIFKNLFTSTLGLDIEALDFMFVTNNEPICDKSSPQQHLMISGDIIMVTMKKMYYLPPVPPSMLSNQMKAVVNDPLHSDVVFNVAGEKLYAHKAILSARCEKFRSMLQNNMKESDQREIDLQIESSSVMLALLEYIYTDTVENFTCELAYELMVLADEYLLTRLRRICEIQLQTFVNIENASSMLAYAHHHNANDLKQFCLNFIMKNFASVSETQGYLDLCTDPELLLQISRLLPQHLAQPINLLSHLTPKGGWPELILLPALFIVIAGLVVYLKRG